MNGFLDLLKKFSPIDEEQETAPAAAPVSIAPAPAAVVAPTPDTNQGGIPELTASSLLDQYAVPRQANYVAPRIQIPGDEEDNERQKARDIEFKTNLEDLKDQYNQNRQSAAKRQMYAEMLAALGNNIGTIVSGAQAMNTKANVQPVKTAQINVRDQIAAVDKRFDGDYDNLIKQYKDLKDGGLTAKDRLYANIAQAQLDNSAKRMNANIENTDRNAGVGIGKAKLKDQADNEISDKEKAALDDMDNTLGQIDSVIADAHKFKDKLGPNAADFEDAKTGRLGSVITKVSPIDKEYTAFRSTAKALKGAYQKVISGLTVSDTERKELEGYVPHERMPYDAFMANADSFKKRVAEIRAKTLSNSKKFQGKNTEGYSQPSKEAPQAAAPSAPNGQDVVERNGKTYKWNSAAGKYQLLVK